jgi:hypothetical protein
MCGSWLREEPQLSLQIIINVRFPGSVTTHPEFQDSFQDPLRDIRERNWER